ncbi:MAG TPA: acyl-CoA dehydrogenase family protein, partial [Membranihabitans sp.]|nr:acyl-CoA dehydrogenase family protein [Membranihabitans sp.]
MAYPFKYHDYFDLDSQLTEEIQMARDAVRDWVDREIVPTIEKHALQGSHAREWMKQLGELGCFGPSLPIDHGGHGLTETGYGVLMRELERG